MSNPHVKVHPLGDRLAGMLHGIEGVPRKEQGRMVYRAIKEAMKWYDEEQDRIRGNIKKEWPCTCDHAHEYECMMCEFLNDEKVWVKR